MQAQLGHSLNFQLEALAQLFKIVMQITIDSKPKRNEIYLQNDHDCLC